MAEKIEEKRKIETSKKEQLLNLEETLAYGSSEARLVALTPVLGLQRIDSLKHEIKDHYIASLISQDLEKQLAQREQIIKNLQEELTALKNEAKGYSEQKDILKVKIEVLSDRQQECLKEYQDGVQELEAETIEIDRQIQELQKRKAEIREQQGVRLKDQDEKQMELQNEIERLETGIAENGLKQGELELKIATFPIPEDLNRLDNRINDLIHHICVIFNPVDEHPDEEEAMRHTSPGLVMPPIFQLVPWAAEENKGLTKLKIPVGAKQLIFSLHLPENKQFNKYAAELYASNGRRVWTGDNLNINGRIVNITFNSMFFLSDDYELRLRGRNEERNFTPVAEYYFQINKG